MTNATETKPGLDLQGLLLVTFAPVIGALAGFALFAGLRSSTVFGTNGPASCGSALIWNHTWESNDPFAASICESIVSRDVMLMFGSGGLALALVLSLYLASRHLRIEDGDSEEV